MIWLVDAVLAVGAAVFFVWDERRRRRARALRAWRIRELEWETGVEPRREDLLYEALAGVTGSTRGDETTLAWPSQIEETG